MKIQLPIDTSAVSFIDVMPPEPVLDRQTNQQMTDANGEPLYSIELVCVGAEGDEILSVNFPGTPPAGIRQGMPEGDGADGHRLGHRGPRRAHVQGRQGGAAVRRGRRNWPSSPVVVRRWLEPMKPQPQFLRIRWEETTEQGAAVTLEAILCLRHRQEIARASASARGAGGRGEDCDLCLGRHPRPLGSDLSQFASQSARVP